MSSNLGTTGDSDTVLFSSLAKVQEKKWGYPPEGVLALTRDRRLVFLNRNGILYDWPLAEVSNLWSPWYVLGTAFHCEVGGHRYYVSFSKLSSTARNGLMVLGAGAMGAAAGVASAIPLARGVAGVMEIASASSLCSDWKAAIAAAREVSPPAE